MRTKQIVLVRKASYIGLAIPYSYNMVYFHNSCQEIEILAPAFFPADEYACRSQFIMREMGENAGKKRTKVVWRNGYSALRIEGAKAIFFGKLCSHRPPGCQNPASMGRLGRRVTWIGPEA